MRLADTCDELEEALAAVSGPQTYGRYLRALVKWGEALSNDCFVSGPEDWLRFAELKERVEAELAKEKS